MLEELSELIGADVLRKRDGKVSVVSGLAALLIGVVARPLSAALTPEGIKIVDEDGRDLTASLERAGGRLAGALEARNTLLPSLRNDLDRLAKRFADSVNEQSGAALI